MALYVCNLCKKEDEDFTVPADIFGVAIMNAHLREKHGVKNARSSIVEGRADYGKRVFQEDEW